MAARAAALRSGIRSRWGRSSAACRTGVRRARRSQNSRSSEPSSGTWTVRSDGGRVAMDPRSCGRAGRRPSAPRAPRARPATCGEAAEGGRPDDPARHVRPPARVRSPPRSRALKHPSQSSRRPGAGLMRARPGGMGGGSRMARLCCLRTRITCPSLHRRSRAALHRTATRTSVRSHTMIGRWPQPLEQPDRRLRGPRAQPEGHLAGAAPRRSRRDHRAVRVGQVQPRVRHDLRRGPTALC